MAVNKRQIQYVIDGYVNGKFHKAFNTVEKRMKNVRKLGSTLNRNVTLPLLAAGSASLVFANKLNEGMANVATLIPKQTARVAELKAGLQDLAPIVGKTTGDLTEGLYQTISAFGDSSDTLQKLKINAKAATGGLATTLDAINLTSAVTKAYGDTSAKAVGKASDLALLTVRLGQTTFPELASSIGKVTPLTKALSVSQEELFGVMATATGVTGGAAEVSTQLRGIMQSLLAPTEATSKLMKKYGYANGEALIKAKGLQGAIDLIVSGAKKSGQPLQKYISSIEGQTLAMSLSGAQSKDLTAKIKAMEKASGTTDAAFKEQTEGINKAGFALKQVTAKGEVMAQRFGDALAPALLSVLKVAEPLIGKVSKLTDWFAKLSPQGQTAILALLGIAVAAGPVITGIAGIVTAGVKIRKAVVFLKNLHMITKLVTAAQWLWNTSIAGCPLVWIIAGVLALGAGIYLLVKNWDKVKAAIFRAWNWVVKFVVKASNFIPVIAAIKYVVKHWGNIKAAIFSAYSWVKNFIVKASNFNPIVIAIKAIIKYWDKVTAAIKKAWDLAKKFGSVTLKATPIGMATTVIQKVAGRRASGGPVSAGKRYLVGERGPEYFVPRISGLIIPNSGPRTAAAAAGPGGGITVNLTVNASGAGGNIESGIKQGADYLVRELRKIARNEERRSFD